VFLLATYLFFFSLRTRNPSLATKLELIGDVIFLVALTGMVATGFIILYRLVVLLVRVRVVFVSCAGLLSLLFCHLFSPLMSVAFVPHQKKE
jgi:hypothetical protein